MFGYLNFFSYLCNRFKTIKDYEQEKKTKKTK